MTVTPIFDDLAASWAAAPPVRRPADPGRRPSPRPRATVVGSAAFGRGCLEAAAPEPVVVDDEVTRLLDGARREAVALGRRRVGTVHLAVAAVRAGGDVGRVFGMRGVGPAVLLTALEDDDDTPDELDGGDPVRPALSSVARTVLHRATHRAAREDRAVTAAELAVAVARTGRVADLLGRLGVDLEDLADALTAGGAPGPARGLDAETVPLRRVPVPVGVLAPVTVMPSVGGLPPAGRPPATVPAVPDDRAAGVPA